MGLEIGMSVEIEREVTYEMTAEVFGSGYVKVFATPYMIAFMEEAAAQAVLPGLAEGTTTVGTKVNIEHVAATPVGMRVRISSVLKEIDGRKLLFDVEASDGRQRIGFGTHERFIVNKEKFTKNAEAKL